MDELSNTNNMKSHIQNQELEKQNEAKKPVKITSGLREKLVVKDKEIEKERIGMDSGEVITDIDRIISKNAAPKGKDIYIHNANKSVSIGTRLKTLGIVVSLILTLTCFGLYAGLFIGVFDWLKDILPILFTTEGLLIVSVTLLVVLVFVWTFGFLIVAAGQNLIDKALMLEEFRKISNTIKSIDNH